MWNTIFGMANLWALLAWTVLIALPRKPVSLSALMYAGVGLLCLAYVLLVALVLGGLVHTGGEQGAISFTSVPGVRAIFSTDAGVTIGWIHYLALDLFAGLWIARDAEAKAYSRLLQAPVLLLTFMAGPAGLGVWLLVREGRARAVAGPRKRLR
ncbi:ABA4-like family protein [Aurantiacibacter spongiae]|uniref:DUF4281 domain-containing protein n=1 Tax=Aurantiacibacter spongiae TaxID=2488860 RepID=A0A3N5DSW0_9SPHN|nr:ABA4-like family protein [Aurantiacibacter spongiae]RPF72371.1 DUF4281 domain-containing protein [Aurantiacibacter spongiae]